MRGGSSPPGSTNHSSTFNRTGFSILESAKPLASASVYASAAGTYLARGFKPIPVEGKSPVPAGCTGRSGTVTAAKVESWTFDPRWAKQNIALRAEGWIGLDVDEYDDKHGADQLRDLEAMLGELPSTITSSARGPESESRQHFFRIPEGIELQSKPADDIEVVQFHHRYSVVAPSIHPNGQPYVWYGYEGDALTGPPRLTDFEDLPQRWIDHLTVAAPVKHTGFEAPASVGRTPASASTGFGGSVEAWLDTVEAGAPDDRMHYLISDIPTDDFGHDRMLALAFKIVRLGAEGHPGSRDALTALYAAWLRFPYNTPDYQRGIATAVQGAIAKAGARIEYPALSPFLDVANLLPEYTSTGRPFLPLYTELPEVSTDAHLNAQRSLLATEAMLAGLDDQQTASLVWGSRVGQSLQPAIDGERTLWSIVEAARDKHVARPVEATESAAATSAPAADVRPALTLVADKPLIIDLLSAAEKQLVDAHTWFGSRYMEWAETRVKAMNAPYHRMNRWTILSLVFAPSGQIPLGEGEMGCNLFQFVLGPTTSGKSASMKLLKAVLKACFPGDTSPNIGGDASPNSLVEKLIERDGLPSWFNADEAHGLFKEMQGVTWRSGLREKWTMLYENEVPIILRNGKKELSGIEATTFFVMHLMGTHEGMAEVLDAEFWTSGFLARYVWAIGDKIERTPESMKLNLRRGAKSRERDPQPGQWAAEFEKAKAAIAKLSDTSPAILDMTLEAEARHNRFVVDVDRVIGGHRHQDRLQPTAIRFGLNILKCAALIAMADGRVVINLADTLLAIDQAGEWLTNIIIMVNDTDESPLTRDVGKLERVIASQPGQQIDKRRLYALSPRSTKRATDELLEQLTARGRAKELAGATGNTLIKLEAA